MEKWLVILLYVLGALIVLYILYIIISFFFLNSFNKKILNEIRAISVLLYQKSNVIKELSIYLIDYTKDLKDFKDFEINELKEYRQLNSNEIKTINNLYKNIYNEFKTILINNKIKNYKEVSNDFNLLEDLEKRFFITSQIYNNNVVAFNYWRNLKGTKYIKKIFKIKEKELIL